LTVCEKCGREVALPFKCSYCGGNFCPDHRLPENHDCKGVTTVVKKNDATPKTEIKTQEPRPFNFRYDFSTLQPPKKRRPKFSFPAAGMALLILIVLVFIVQLAAQIILGPAYYRPGDHDSFLYYLAAARATVMERPWTIITCIFVHGGLLHLLFNCIVLLSFGPILEARIGSKSFLYLFFGAGILASLGQLLFTAPEAVLLGASGAILGVLGTLTVLAPRLPVLLFFFIPLRLWMATLGFGILSAFLAVFEIGGSIANVAHFVGLIVGLLYGYKLKRNERKTQALIKKFLGPVFETIT